MSTAKQASSIANIYITAMRVIAKTGTTNNVTHAADLAASDVNELYNYEVTGKDILDLLDRSTLSEIEANAWAIVRNTIINSVKATPGQQRITNGGNRSLMPKEKAEIQPSPLDNYILGHIDELEEITSTKKPKKINDLFELFIKRNSDQNKNTRDNYTRLELARRGQHSQILSRNDRWKAIKEAIKENSKQKEPEKEVVYVSSFTEEQVIQLFNRILDIAENNINATSIQEIIKTLQKDKTLDPDVSIELHRTQLTNLANKHNLNLEWEKIRTQVQSNTAKNGKKDDKAAQLEVLERLSDQQARKVFENAVTSDSKEKLIDKVLAREQRRSQGKQKPKTDGLISWLKEYEKTKQSLTEARDEKLAMLTSDTAMNYGTINKAALETVLNTPALAAMGIQLSPPKDKELLKKVKELLCD